MFRHLFNKKKNRLYKYHWSLYNLNRFLNLQRILVVLFLIVLFSILRISDNRIKFGKYNYVFDRETILETRSSHFYNITIAQSDSLRMLRFDMSSIQGVIHLKNPFIILLNYMRLQFLCLLWKSEPERILIIGLGAGILPKIFHYLSPNTLIDVVEIDSEIMNLAQKYFDFNENDHIRVYIEDGQHFIKRQPSNQYDVIIIDAFTVKNHVPHKLRTSACIAEYLRTLKSTGLVIGNFFYEQEIRYRQIYKRTLFKQIYRGIIQNNHILIGLNQQAKIFNQTELQLRARNLQQSKPLFDMNWIDETKYIHIEYDDQ